MNKISLKLKLEVDIKKLRDMKEKHYSAKNFLHRMIENDYDIDVIQAQYHGMENLKLRIDKLNKQIEEFFLHYYNELTK
jgi:hypothetical protein